MSHDTTPATPGAGGDAATAAPRDPELQSTTWTLVLALSAEQVSGDGTRSARLAEAQAAFERLLPAEHVVVRWTREVGRMMWEEARLWTRWELFTPTVATPLKLWSEGYVGEEWFAERLEDDPFVPVVMKAPAAADEDGAAS
ncbi:hypothetical protein [Clavibacter capsici]|uniref:Uncharacterized protein n=1 Tax=Clavibacter capsici TaxID=1874630 RepID=A0AAE6XP92_9MICO|nr:hypothetical protein [Clavibacter capsici]ALD11983.1 hypothetical protein AES38_02675 [Clavibacter capsici]QIS44074.1 hypothetical protein GW570_02685 [Clavibacter capsici]